MFVIYLIDQQHFYNHLGYWTGKSYTHQGEKYQICEDRITENTKRYSTEKRAETAASKLGWEYRIEKLEELR